MPKTFTYQIHDDPEILIEKLRQKTNANGINFNGNAVSGKFEGKGFEGEYTIASSMVSITINKKLFIVPWSIVEKKLGEQIRAIDSSH